jgi:hypothetical protein
MENKGKKVKYKQLFLLLFAGFFAASVNGQTITGLYINEFLASNSAINADEFGEYDDWFEIYNSNNEAINIGGLYVTDDLDEPDKWQIPANQPAVTTIPAAGFLLIWADGQTGQGPLHVDFKLGAGGEEIGLFQELEGEFYQIDGFSFGPQTSNVSYGREEDGGEIWQSFTIPTPGESNNASLPQLTAPSFSQEGGYFTEAFELIISVDDPQAEIRYTFNGSEPTDTSQLYNSPILIDSRDGDSNYFSMFPPNFVEAGPSVWYPPATELFKGTVVRARVFKENATPSPVVTQTYFVDAEIFSRYDLPVFSIATDEANFFDDSIGIYVPGRYYKEGNDETGNYFQTGDNWERPAHLEMFNLDGERELAQDLGVRIHGAASRVVPQKSLRLYASTEFNYPFFSDKNLPRYKRLILRNSGNDRVSSMFRDAFMGTLARDMDGGLDYMASMPAVLFLNGEFWGIHNLRERIDKYFLADNYGGEADPDDLDYLEKDGEIKEGDNIDYWRWYNFLESADMTLPSNYDSMAQWIDVENFRDYNIAEIFFANVDWPSNNRDFWRPHIPGGKWRWVVFDNDFGFGWETYSHYDHNTLVFATTPDGPTQPPAWASNRPWATMQLRKMLQNERFRNDFINRFADMLNSVFSESYVTQRIDETAAFYEHVMPEHIERWGKPESMSAWQWHINRMKTFAENRPDYLRGFILDYFDEVEPLAENIEEIYTLSLNVNLQNSGAIRVNTITPLNYPWSGLYFENIPFEVEAIPQPGYKFSKWEESNETNPLLMVTLQQNLSLTALFELDPNYHFPIRINEFLASNVASNTDEYGEYDDWIELYNPNDVMVDVGGYYLTDDLAERDKVQLPTENSATQIPGGGFLLIWADDAPSQGPLHVNFKLSKSGEAIGLYHPDDLSTVDSVIFGAQADDRSFGRSPDGAANWAVMTPTPGSSNNPVSIAGENLPTDYFLHHAYPNPFNGATTLRFDLPAVSDVTLTIYNIRGEVVRTLAYDKRMMAGSHSIIWDGLNEQRQTAASGVYLYLLRTPEFRGSGRMVMMK